MGEEAHALHLVEDGVVAGVDLVSAVHVSRQQEGVQAGAHQVALVGGGVRSEHVTSVQEVVVPLLPAGVVRGDQEAVEVLLHRHHGAQVVEGGEDGVPATARVGPVEVGLHPLLEQAQRVVGQVVQVPAHFGQDLGRDVGVVVSRVGEPQHFHALLSIQARGRGLRFHPSVGEESHYGHQTPFHQAIANPGQESWLQQRGQGAGTEAQRHDNRAISLWRREHCE